MAWPFKTRAASITASDLLGWRTAARAGFGSPRQVSTEQALRASAVWACLRLRADLVSTMPVEVLRNVGGVNVDVPKPPFFVTPGGDRVDWCEWAYSTEFDLDSSGNTFGIVTETVGNRPSRVDLVPLNDCVVQVRDGRLTYKLAGEEYPPEQVWHEKQFTMAGCPVGLSPIAYAAASISGYLSAQQFAADWFSGSAIPSAMLRNTVKKVGASDAADIKARFKATITSGDVFVTGADWDYSMIAAKASESMFIEERRFGIGDICRFLGVPGDMIDADTTTNSITYANITQRNLQLLITNIGPAIARREATFSRLLVPGPHRVKLNTDSLLRMDPQTLATVLQTQIDSWALTPDEARALSDRAPLTEAQMQQFERKNTARRMSESVQAGPTPESLVTDGAVSND